MPSLKKVAGTRWQHNINYKKNKTINKAKNNHDPHWDPTRDHGELQAKMQIDRYATFLARGDRG